MYTRGALLFRKMKALERCEAFLGRPLPQSRPYLTLNQWAVIKGSFLRQDGRSPGECSQIARMMVNGRITPRLKGSEVITQVPGGPLLTPTKETDII